MDTCDRCGADVMACTEIRLSECLAEFLRICFDVDKKPENGFFVWRFCAPCVFEGGPQTEASDERIYQLLKESLGIYVQCGHA